MALSRDLDLQYKTAFVPARKLREAMASELNVKARHAIAVAISQRAKRRRTCSGDRCALPAGEAGTVARSQNKTPASPLSSITDN